MNDAADLQPRDLRIFKEHFLSLEQDFINTIPFVEVHPKNFDAFSTQYLKLILAVGAEIDVVTRLLAQRCNPNKQFRGMKGRSEAIYSKYDLFHFAAVKPQDKLLAIGLEGAGLAPWGVWFPGEININGQVQKNISKEPDWWTAYNELKHHRHLNFEKANQKTAMDSMAALFIAIKYLYIDVGSSPHRFEGTFFKLA
ncbi:hypothetical protein [Cerasicoccus frondis]|uniref:hypothetical protein n=1 Tax=Cerasicoccus frondis TaxID=490090 RepID=UPI002852512E|nr:hypothetical protein [Cerasicoccus frondis]